MGGGIVRFALVSSGRSRHLQEPFHELEASRAGVTFEELLRRTVAFDELIARASTRFLTLPRDELETTFRRTMAEVGQETGVDRCSWFRIDPEAATMGCDTEWTSPALPADLPRPRDVPLSELPDWFGRLTRGEPVALARLDEAAPSDRAWVERLRRIGVRSLLTVPVVRAGRAVGFLGMANLQAERVWLPSEVDSLRVIAEIFARLRERQETEAALHESRERYARFFRELQSGCALFDVRRDAEGGRIRLAFREVNPAFTQLTGRGQAEVAGRSVEEVFPRLESYWTSALLAVARFGQPLTLRHPMGEAGKHLSAVVFLVGLDELAFTARDVSDQVRNAEELRKLQEDLTHAQKMEAVGTLASGVAHDFNNLLHAISGYSQLCLSLVEPESKAHRYLERIEVTVGRASELVRNLLAFSRRGDLRLAPLNLNEELRRGLEILRRILPKMIRVEARLAPDLWPMGGNSGQLQQVLLNLASNANDAMPEGGVLLVETRNALLDEAFCRCHAEARPGDYVLLRIADTGAGMDEETLKHVFEPFYTTKAVGKGTGLGLATVYGVVRAHEGFLTCASEKDRGTAFDLYFPALRFRAGEEKAPDETEAEVAEPAVPRGRGETVLLVDDEPSVREVCGDLLEALGYRVLRAASGEEALAVHTEYGREVDVVILDIGMPGMGGRRALRELKRIDPAARVIVASGYADAVHGADMIAAGARAFLEKPYRAVTLARALREALVRQT
jgi:signal transduction histidine kinase/ActR/RegA family two-component response regulator